LLLWSLAQRSEKPSWSGYEPTNTPTCFLSTIPFARRIASADKRLLPSQITSPSPAAADLDMPLATSVVPGEIVSVEVLSRPPV
jgi:hypothetical protein